MSAGALERNGVAVNRPENHRGIAFKRYGAVASRETDLTAEIQLENHPAVRLAEARVATGVTNVPTRQSAPPTVLRQRSGGAPNRRLNARLKPASEE